MNNKMLNSKCMCGSGLIWNKYKQIMIEPCEHIFHYKCLLKQKDKTKCHICGVKITGSYTLSQLQDILSTQSKAIENAQRYRLYQKYVDMVSMTNFDNIYSGKKNLFNFIDIIGIASSFPFLSGYDDGKNGCREVLSLMNSKIFVNGMKNIDPHMPKVYIANHTTYIDFVIIFYLLKCGFLASIIIKDSWIGRQIMNIIPLLIIERGKDTNTVDRMREYVKKNGSICLFPEGMITHPDTIIRFRTGAFHVGYPIHPVVIRYDPVIYDTDINKLIEKLSSQPNTTIYVDILPAEYPPFNSEKIELIRKKMGKTGNLALSRVCNRDIKD